MRRDRCGLWPEMLHGFQEKSAEDGHCFRSLSALSVLIQYFLKLNGYVILKVVVFWFSENRGA